MVSLVTAAAPNTNFADEVRDEELMYKTVQAIFAAPRIQEPRTECLVLGAWGCGAYGGNPADIVELFARALKEGLGNLYKQVHFAIPQSNPGAAGCNADVFR